jgi:hypothetical protein
LSIPNFSFQSFQHRQRFMLLLSKLKNHPQICYCFASIEFMSNNISIVLQLATCYLSRATDSWAYAVSFLFPAKETCFPLYLTWWTFYLPISLIR